jgi:tyrosyl-tRNA synthetase
LITQGGVKLNGEKVGEVMAQINPAATPEVQLQVGKLKFLKIVFTQT